MKTISDVVERESSTTTLERSPSPGPSSPSVGDNEKMVEIPSIEENDTSAAVSDSDPSWLIRYVVAIIVVICQVAATTISSVVQNDLGFNKPFFLIYFGTNTLLLCFPLQAIFIAFHAWEQGKIDSPASFWHELIHSFQASTALTPTKLALYSLPFTLLCFYYYGFLTLSLSLTNIASSLSLEQCTTIFVFVLSLILLKEQSGIAKVLAVAICILGAVFIALADQFSNRTAPSSPQVLSDISGWDSLFGDLLVVLSSVCASLFMVLYKIVLSDLPMAIPAVNSFLFFIGLWNLILLWPGFIILNFTGWEVFELPSTWELIGLILLMFSLSFLFNYFLNIGVIISSPLFMRIVVICSVPVTFVVNAIFFEETINLMRIAGAGLIISGFVLFTTAQYFAEISRKDAEEEEGVREQISS